MMALSVYRLFQNDPFFDKFELRRWVCDQIGLDTALIMPRLTPAEAAKEVAPVAEPAVESEHPEPVGA